MSERSKFGLLGFGIANAGVAAYLADRGVSATVWALPHHRTVHILSGHNDHDHDHGNNNTYPFNEAASLEQLIELHHVLILAAPADAQELYVAALEELNHLLRDTILLVVDGNDSTLLYHRRLKVKYVIESCLYYTAPRLADDQSTRNVNGAKEERELSHSPCRHQGPAEPPCDAVGLPDDVVRLLHGLARFGAEVRRQESGVENIWGGLLLQKSKSIESFGHIAKFEYRDAPVVTMFSGGLDSTYLLLKLQQLGFTNIHAVAVDVGAPMDEDGLTKSAAHFGASFKRLDGRELFIQTGVAPAIRAHAMYMGMYPVSSSLSRPVIARLATEYANALNAGLLLHTANLSQNSLPRLNNSIQHCGFPGRFGSPYVRSFVSREVKAKELAAVGLTVMSGRKLSSDENLWCREFEAGPLDDPERFDIPEDAYRWTACGPHHPPPETLTLTFEKGHLIAVNGDRLPLVDAIALLNQEVGKYGHGRFVGLEPIRTDEKVLEVREAPAATIIMDALRHLEVATLESNTLSLKQHLEQQWTWEAISGRWGSMHQAMCDAAIASTLNGVGGSVTYHIDHTRYLPCSIVAATPRYIRDRDRWEQQESLRGALVPGTPRFEPPARL